MAKKYRTSRKSRRTEADPVSNAVLRHAGDACSCGISIADAAKKGMPLVYVNKTFERLTGYKKSEMLGKNCRFLQGPDSRQAGVRIVREALRKKQACTAILRNYRKDGTAFWNELALAPVFGGDGKLTHYIGIQTDISRRIEAEEALKRERQHLETLVRERTLKLEEKNLALREILSQIEIEKKGIRDQVVRNVETVVIPLLEKLKARMDPAEHRYAELIRKKLVELTSAFGETIARKFYRLTPREIEICHMIRSGLSNKEIAGFFHVSLSTVENQRNAIRKKLGISRKEVNLATYLQSLPPEQPHRTGSRGDR
jgi:PAS domain S-box-containing protein